MPEIEIDHDASPELYRYVSDRLYAFNAEATGIDDGQGLGFVVRSADGDVQAALLGTTWGQCCEVLMLWVDASLRGSGIGRGLMERAEAEARRRGCVQIVLNTHSFQAPDFYRKLGFAVEFELDGYPRGHAELLLRKRL